MVVLIVFIDSTIYFLTGSEIFYFLTNQYIANNY